MEIVFRAAFVFAFLWFIVRITGRVTLGELSTFELMLYITMGDLVQQSVTQQDYSVGSAVLAVGTFCLLTILLSFLNSRVRRLRPVTHGTAVVIVERGLLVEANLRAEMVAVNDLLAAARNQGIERIDDIRLAVLETNGRISFFTADQHSGAPDPPPVG
jgi:uncharacterized membrane protein YcaP (DUF421 family)